jgi:septum formation protein
MTTLEAIEKLNSRDIILASKSPRRQQLMKELGLKFRVINDLETEETYPLVLKADEIAAYIARVKASCYNKIIEKNTLLITADTIVWFENEVIGKPSDLNEAVHMLKRLSGNMHEVFTGVCIRSVSNEITFHTQSKVFFRKLSEDEILYYVNKYKPLDKAGAYGVQEWIGYTGVEKIEGSFYNVMGLPVQRLYCELLKFI